VSYQDVEGQARGKGEPLEVLRKRNPERVSDVNTLVKYLGRREDDLRFLPLRAGKTDLTVVIDAKTGEILKISSIKPWGDV
jgi:hypothetical protein